MLKQSGPHKIGSSNRIVQYQKKDFLFSLERQLGQSSHAVFTGGLGLCVRLGLAAVGLALLEALCRSAEHPTSLGRPRILRKDSSWSRLLLTAATANRQKKTPSLKQPLKVTRQDGQGIGAPAETSHHHVLLEQCRINASKHLMPKMPSLAADRACNDPRSVSRLPNKCRHGPTRSHNEADVVQASGTFPHQGDPNLVVRRNVWASWP